MKKQLFLFAYLTVMPYGLYGCCCSEKAIQEKREAVTKDALSRITPQYSNHTNKDVTNSKQTCNTRTFTSTEYKDEEIYSSNPDVWEIY